MFECITCSMVRKRTLVMRTCKQCGKQELVRTDQLNCTCADCGRKNIAARMAAYAIAHPEELRKRCGDASRKHGMRSSRIYRIHKAMMHRCGHYKHRHKWAQYYEDKGVRVCPEWHQFTVFFEWAKNNGYRDDLTIDRINGDIGYTPENCRWVDRKTQQNNRSNSRSRRWSWKSNCCEECGTTSVRHAAKGLCKICYRKKRTTTHTNP